MRDGLAPIASDENLVRPWIQANRRIPSPSSDDSTSPPPLLVTFVRDLAEVVSRATTIDALAEKYELDFQTMRSLEVELVNAVTLRRMVDGRGNLVSNVPTQCIEVFAQSIVTRRSGRHVITYVITVTNDLPVALTGVRLHCVSFSNASLRELKFDGPLVLTRGDSDNLRSRDSLEYRAQYTADSSDLSGEGEIICSFLADGFSVDGELVLAQEDAWTELAW